jgi:pimeloyl-ACP methyl ester carboxylesterase
MKQSLPYKNGHTLSYTEYGDPNGYPILIQHGLIASITDYELFERLIRLGTRLICTARPGYGESSPYVMKNMAEWGEITAVLVEELKLPQFDVLGMSSGAPYSYAIGAGLPDKARNIFIFSGIPALCDEKISSFWPWEVKKNAELAEMQRLAYDLFFAHATAQDLARQDIQDSMRHDCFGVGQDLKIRGMDWGFKLCDVKEKVWMRHSRADPSVPWITADMTAKLLPNCQFETRETDVHFSNEAIDDFIETVMAGHYRSHSILPSTES